MQYLQKERKGSKCEAQNMPGEASVILASRFILLHTLLEPLPQALGVIASDLEQEEFPLTEHCGQGIIWNLLFHHSLWEEGEKGKGVNECVLQVPRWNFKCVFLEKYFGPWCLVSIEIIYCKLQVHCGLNGFLWAYLRSLLPCISIGQYVPEFRRTNLCTCCQKVKDYVCRNWNQNNEIYSQCALQFSERSHII